MPNLIRLELDGPDAFDASQPKRPAPPEPRTPIRIRPARLADYDFIDDLQKRHKKGVGFMWEKAIKGHIEKGNVLVAEADAGRRAGYILGVDRYLKRDELGIIYQMNVEPEFQRSLVAANLLKSKFERSAYGCRLYCCWCAQDLAANKFWEAMGFVPLAFRTGGGRNRKDGPRMHIFWQKRIREGDHGPSVTSGTSGGDASGGGGGGGGGGTAYWFPSLTGAGAIGEDRIVLPIPPGTHWSDAKPIVLPEGPRKQGDDHEILALESEVQRLERERKKTAKNKKRSAVQQSLPTQSIELGGLRFGASPVETQSKQTAEAEVDAELKAAKQAVKKAKKKFDPAQEAFARELKDRWLEQVLADPHLIAPAHEKYAVSRRIAGQSQASADGADAHGGLKITEPKRLDAA